MKFYASIDVNNKIIPCTDYDYDIFRKIKKNNVVKFEITQQRNLKFHRKFFLLIKILFENQENYKDFEKFRKDLIIASGFYEEYTNFFTGEIRMEAKSIAFQNMKEEEFSDVYSAVIDTANKLISFDKKELLEQIEQYF